MDKTEKTITAVVLTATFPVLGAAYVAWLGAEYATKRALTARAQRKEDEAKSFSTRLTKIREEYEQRCREIDRLPLYSEEREAAKEYLHQQMLGSLRGAIDEQ